MFESLLECPPTTDSEMVQCQPELLGSPEFWWLQIPVHSPELALPKKCLAATANVQVLISRNQRR